MAYFEFAQRIKSQADGKFSHIKHITFVHILAKVNTVRGLRWSCEFACLTFQSKIILNEGTVNCVRFYSLAFSSAVKCCYLPLFYLSIKQLKVPSDFVSIPYKCFQSSQSICVHLSLTCVKYILLRQRSGQKSVQHVELFNNRRQSCIPRPTTYVKFKSSSHMIIQFTIWGLKMNKILRNRPCIGTLISLQSSIQSVHVSRKCLTVDGKQLVQRRNVWKEEIGGVCGSVA